MYGMGRDVWVVRLLVARHLAFLAWFHKILTTSTTNFIELRICGAGDEDTPLSLYEIYIK